MGYSSRRPHRVLLLSAKIRKRRLQFTQSHQNWTIEDWQNVAWSDESWFLLLHSDGRVRIWRKEHESMDPSCLVSTVQAAGGDVMVWGDILLAHFRSLSNWALCKHHSLPEYCHKAQIISDWFLEHDKEFTLLKWPPQSPDLNPIEHHWDVVEREIPIMDVQPTNLQQLRDAIMSIWTKTSGMFPTPCWIYARSISVLKAKGGQTRY